MSDQGLDAIARELGVQRRFHAIRRRENRPWGAGSVHGWPGKEWGVRAPTPDETPLSQAEALCALREGLLQNTRRATPCS